MYQELYPYATLWHRQFPRHAHVNCEWVDLFAQDVPAHVGTPRPGYGYESGDPFAVFLPPALGIEGGVPEMSCVRLSYRAR